MMCSWYLGKKVFQNFNTPSNRWLSLEVHLCRIWPSHQVFRHRNAFQNIKSIKIDPCAVLACYLFLPCKVSSTEIDGFIDLQESIQRNRNPINTKHTLESQFWVWSKSTRWSNQKNMFNGLSMYVQYLWKKVAPNFVFFTCSKSRLEKKKRTFHPPVSLRCKAALEFLQYPILYQNAWTRIFPQQDG